MTRPSGSPAQPTEPAGGDWFTPGRFAIVLGVLICACFPQVILGLEVFNLGDAGQFAYPVAYYVRESFWRGELPLWNPSSSCGIPFLAQWNTLALYPPSLFYVLLPFSWSFGVFCLGHVFWAGLGMYCLACRWTSHRLGAAVAGVAFGFNGLMWGGIAWPHLLAALAWMPWVVLTVSRAWREGGRMLAVAALTGGMQMLSGGVEAILQTWLILAVFWVSEWIERSKDECVAQAAAGAKRWTLTWRAALVVAEIAGLAAIQLLPFFELLQHSHRAADQGRLAELHPSLQNFASMPATGWLNYLVPLFHCARDPLGMYSGQPWLGSYYLGIAVVALALVAVWRAHQRRAWILAGITVFGLLLAMGGNAGVSGWCGKLLPVLRMIRFPIKFVMLVTFAIPLLAAYGVRWLAELPQERWPRERRLLKAGLLGLLAAVGLIVCAGWMFPKFPGEGGVVSGNAAVRAVFLLLSLGAILLLRRQRELKMQRFLQLGLVALLWFDVFTHTPDLSPTVPRALLTPNLARSSFEWPDQLGLGGSRAMLAPDTYWRLCAQTFPNAELDARIRRSTLCMNNNLLDGVPKIEGLYSCDLDAVYSIYEDLYLRQHRSEGLEDFLGISCVGSLGDTMSWTARSSAMPLVTAGQQPVFADKTETLTALASDGFAPLRTLYLPAEARGCVAASGPAKARVDSVRFSAHRVEAQVESDAPTLLAVAQSYYPAWQASVDARPVRLWRANHAFQAVEVPAGKHQVVLAYRDQAFRMGAVISLLSLAFCAVGLRWR